jgi:tetratricopeptide (TPR) repeat protein
MQNRTQLAIEKQNVAKSFRKKGDALRKAGREDGARDAFRAGLTALSESRELLRVEHDRLNTMSTPLPDEAASTLLELVETYGALAGMQQRLGLLDEALENYSIGATLEEQFNLPGTYNRLNAVRYALITGRDRLHSLTTKIQMLADLIERNVRADKGLSDSGWAWADLGDCLALLGRSEEASRAYATFIAKAEIKSPERTLDVLSEIASSLRTSGDPEAQRVLEAVAALRSKIATK